MIGQRSPREPAWVLRVLLLAASVAAGFFARGRAHRPIAMETVAPPAELSAPELPASERDAPEPELIPLSQLPPPVVAEPVVAEPVVLEPVVAAAPRVEAALPQPATPGGWRLPAARSTVGAGLIFFAAVSVSLLAAALLSGSPSDSKGQPRAGADRGHRVRGFSSRALQASGRPRGSSVVARTKRNSIRVYSRPHGQRARMRLSRRIVSGKRIPLVFLVDGRRRGWLHVRLPVRPNGGRGWVRRREVALALTTYRIVIDVRRHRLTLFRLGRAIDHEPIATGGAYTPTPNGRYFITDLVRPPDPHGLYGPYAFGTSAFSSVLTNFAGGVGQIGLHGTDTPAVLGTDVSHGCIRVRNRTIRRFATRLPLGTPVRIKGGVKPQAVAAPAAPPASQTTTATASQTATASGYTRAAPAAGPGA